MPIGAIAGAISGGSSLLQGILGGNAADKAASQLAAAGNKAASLAGQAGQEAQGYQTGQIAKAGQQAAPYTTLGAGTANYLGNLLAPGGALTQGFGAFQAPTGVDYTNDPGYQFRLQQGMAALQNSAAARGGLLSTGTAKNLMNFGQGLGSEEYQNVFNRALQGYGANFNTFQANQNNLFNRLYGATGLGLNATNALNAVQQAGTQNLTNNLLGTAQLQGNDIMGVGNALAAGTVGGANALSGGIGGALGSVGGILGALNASGRAAPQTPTYNILPAELQAQGLK